LVLFEDGSGNFRVVLSADAEPHLQILNRHLALLSMMGRALIGLPLAADFADVLEAETAKVWQDRQKRIGNDPVVIVEVRGDIVAAIPENAREILNFILCFDALDKNAVKSSHRQQISAVLTALRIGTEEPVEFQYICDGTYLHTDDGRIVHSVTAETGVAHAYVSKLLSGIQKGRITETIPLAIQASDLERVMRLYAYSLTVESDNYRAFLSSWTALEILVGKLFVKYHTQLVSDLRNAYQSPGLKIYLDRITSVMDGKHSLSDKFAVLSVYLDVTHSADEVDSFIALKKVRDQLSHGVEIDDATLPTRDVQRLFDKYIRSHLRGGPRQV
jgi:hypothetical protein